MLSVLSLQAPLRKGDQPGRNFCNAFTVPPTTSSNSDQAQKNQLLSTNVLGLAGIELILFVVASMGLCFGFVVKTVLIIQGCFSSC